MTVRGTLALLALVAILGVAVWKAGSPFEAPRPKGAERPLLDPHATIERVALADAGGQVVATHGPAGWTVAGAFPHAGESITSLLEVLRTVGPLMTIESSPSDLDQYGLGRDATRLSVQGAGDSLLLDLHLGRYNPAWTGCYARLGAEPAVVMIGAIVRWELEKVRRAASVTGNP